MIRTLYWALSAGTVNAALHLFTTLLYLCMHSYLYIIGCVYQKYTLAQLIMVIKQVVCTHMNVFIHSTLYAREAYT
jgi:hypothetical protein